MEISNVARRVAGGLLVAAVVAIGGIIGLSAANAGAQSGDTAIRVALPDTPVKEGDDPITVTVTAENVENLAAFEFLLLYDGDIFDYDSYQKGDFLGSTGREVVCNEVSETGAFKVNCVTLRVAPPLGPDGNGVLATINLKPKGSGTTDLTLDRIKFSAADETATTIPVPNVVNGSITVEGSSGTNYILWGGIIGVVALVVIGAVAFGVTRAGGSKAA